MNRAAGGLNCFIALLKKSRDIISERADPVGKGISQALAERRGALEFEFECKTAANWTDIDLLGDLFQVDVGFWSQL